MDLSPFSPFPPSLNETPFYKYYNHTHLQPPLVLQTNSYRFHFNGHRPTPISSVVAAAVKHLPCNKVRKKRQVSVCANAYGSQNQSTQTNIHEHERRNIFLWEDMIRGYVKDGLCEEALRLYYQMRRAGIEPEKLVFIYVINACCSLSALKTGMEIHQDIIARGFESDVFVGTALTSMYVKCGNLENARQMFDRMPERNVVSWNAIIVGYSRKGYHREALTFFKEMQVQGVKPNSITIVSVLPACADLLALEQGKQIHGYVIRSGCESDIVGTGLVGMYAKCGNVDVAHKLFERMPQRNVVSWTAMIAGCSQNGHPHEALSFFNEMQVQDLKPNLITVVSVLPACAGLLAVEQGKQIHGYVIKNGFESNVVVSTGLVDMYTKCRNVDIALKVFERIPQRNVVSWNAIIGGYSHNGHPREALTFFNEMQVQGIQPNSITIVSVLPACADLLSLDQGKQIHSYIIRNGFESDVVGTGLVDMYAKCGNVDIARRLFEKMPKRDVVSWTAIIAGYSQNGHPHEALAFFKEMQVQGIKPDSITIGSVLPACADLLVLEHGKQIHGYVMRSGFVSDVVLGNGLVDMYAKCGHICIARQLFERMPERDFVSWTAIIAGYSQNGHSHEALALFNEMQVQGIKPDSITMVSVLSGCADLLALEQGKQIHGYAIRTGFESDVAVGNGLVHMYAKCGHIGIARHVFDKMLSRNVVSWNVMILGYGIHGHGEDALALFIQMQQIGTKPDHITFVSVLTACSHAGLVHEGWQYFECMESDYGLAPELEHYACLVDLLGRAGHLNEAHGIIKKMPLEPDAAMWGALLGACRIHCNIELGEEAAKHLFELEPNKAGYYVLLSNIYAEAGRWEDLAKLRTMMRDRGVKKRPGCSFIEVNREVHTFLTGDRTHPQSEKIYAMLETLYGKMNEAGYVSNKNLVLQDVEEEVKENMLCSHSEKLAIAFGIINTCPGTPIRIIKNLRVCSDCHTATKFISKIVVREIIMRDASRFHHVNNGSCSCGDFW
jgi:pentatricopeptide repeat protein